MQYYVVLCVHLIHKEVVDQDGGTRTRIYVGASFNRKFVTGLEPPSAPPDVIIRTIDAWTLCPVSSSPDTIATDTTKSIRSGGVQLDQDIKSC